MMSKGAHAYLWQIGGVDPCRNTADGDGAHVGDKPLRRVEADNVDTRVRNETHGHQALAEPVQTVSKAKGLDRFSKHLK